MRFDAFVTTCVISEPVTWSRSPVWVPIKIGVSFQHLIHSKLLQWGEESKVSSFSNGDFPISGRSRSSLRQDGHNNSNDNHSTRSKGCDVCDGNGRDQLEKNVLPRGRHVLSATSRGRGTVLGKYPPAGEGRFPPKDLSANRSKANRKYSDERMPDYWMTSQNARDCPTCRL